MIELKKLELGNFISHKDTVIDMADLQGLVMIEGHNVNGKYVSNGAGKSTILEGIVYTLTGNTLRNMGVNGMVNRNVGKNTLTKASLTIKGKPLEVTRYRKHEQHGDSVHVINDGVDITKRLNKDTQEELDSLLGISYKVLTNTIFLGEGLSSKFTQLSDGDKKSLIESTLSLDYDFMKSRNEANNELKRIRSELATNRGRITSLENVIADLDRNTLLSNIDILEKSISDSTISRDNHSVDYQKKYDEYQVSIDRVNFINSALTNVKHLESNKSSVLAQVASLKSLWSSATIGKECVVCKQETVTSEAIHNAQEHYMEKLQEQGRILEGVQLQISGYDNPATLSEELKNISPKTIVLNGELNDIQSRITSYASTIAKCTAELAGSKDLLSNADKYEKEVKDLQESLKVLALDEEVYAYWYAAFSPTGLLVKVLGEAVDYLNERIGTYSEMLLDRRYTMELGNGKLSLVDEDSASYETLSNGEKRRLDLAIQFGLHDYVHTYCGLQMDTLFIDEVLDTLDAVGVSNIIEILRIKLSYCSLARIFIITHNPELKSYFDKVLLVTKDKSGFSELQTI